MFRGFTIGVAMLGLLPGVIHAQPPGPMTVSLTLHPAGEARPALKHRLAPEVRDLTRGNAAGNYYQALLLLPKDMPADQAAEFDRWATAPIKDLPKAEIRTKLSSYHLALAEVERAAARDHCDWNMIERLRLGGVGTLLPELQRLRDLSRLLRLRAHIEIAEGKFDDAVATIRVGLVLGRNTPQGPTSSTCWSASPSPATMFEQVEFIEQPGVLHLWTWALTSLPTPFIDIQHAMQGERPFVDNLFLAARGPARNYPLSCS